eukprot:3344673-Amphidinium_carterae.1
MSMKGGEVYAAKWRGGCYGVLLLLLLTPVVSFDIEHRGPRVHHTENLQNRRMKLSEPFLLACKKLRTRGHKSHKVLQDVQILTSGGGSVHICFLCHCVFLLSLSHMCAVRVAMERHCP